MWGEAGMTDTADSQSRFIHQSGFKSITECSHEIFQEIIFTYLVKNLIQ